MPPQTGQNNVFVLGFLEKFGQKLAFFSARQTSELVYVGTKTAFRKTSKSTVPTHSLVRDIRMLVTNRLETALIIFSKIEIKKRI